MLPQAQTRCARFWHVERTGTRVVLALVCGASGALNVTIVTALGADCCVGRCIRSLTLAWPLATAARLCSQARLGPCFVGACMHSSQDLVLARPRVCAWEGRPACLEAMRNVRDAYPTPDITLPFSGFLGNKGGSRKRITPKSCTKDGQSLFVCDCGHCK